MGNNNRRQCNIFKNFYSLITPNKNLSRSPEKYFFGANIEMRNQISVNYIAHKFVRNKYNCYSITLNNVFDFIAKRARNTYKVFRYTHLYKLLI